MAKRAARTPSLHLRRPKYFRGSRR